MFELFFSSSWERIITLASLPLVGAAIGWITNYLAVKMIFRPRKPVKFLFFTLQGLIPMRQRELAAKVGATVERDLLTAHDIQAALSKLNVEQSVQQTVEKVIDRLVEDKLKSIPFLSAFLQGPLLSEIKEKIIQEFSLAAPDLLGGILSKVESELDLSGIVEKKIREFDFSKLEGIIYEISAKELKAIELLGGVLGFTVGLSQLLLMLIFH